MKDFFLNITRPYAHGALFPVWTPEDVPALPAYNLFYALAEDDTQVYVGWNRTEGIGLLVGMPIYEYISVRYVPIASGKGGSIAFWYLPDNRPEAMTEWIGRETKKLDDIADYLEDAPDLSESRKEWIVHTVRTNADTIRQNIYDYMEGFAMAVSASKVSANRREQHQALLQSFPEKQMLASYFYTDDEKEYDANVHIVKTSKGIPFAIHAEASEYITFYPLGHQIYLQHFATPYSPSFSGTFSREISNYMEPYILNPKHLTTIVRNNPLRIYYVYYHKVNDFNPALTTVGVKLREHRPLPSLFQLHVSMYPFPMKLLYALARGEKIHLTEEALQVLIDK